MRKILSLFVAVVPLVLAGCGSSGSSEEPSAAGETPSTPAAVLEPTPDLDPTPTPTREPEPTPTATPTPTPVPLADLATYGWSLEADGAPWGGRAGLRIVELGDSLYLLGGRAPRQSTLPGDSDIFSDVWRSDDLGQTWEMVLASGGPEHWAPRAYFQVATKGAAIFVIGGQDFGLQPNPFCALLEQGVAPPPGLGIDPDAPCPEFLPTSQFFNDVWRSTDGINWEEMTAAAPWSPRAGLSAVTVGDYIYVLGGSQNDDSSIIGPNGPARVYYNDLWRSADGTSWELVTESAPWDPRAGASVVERDGVLWLFGGEDGFTCDPLPDCEPPYFNDVWTFTDASGWQLVAEASAWSPRPGHQCELVGVDFVCFGGFGLIENPTDVWSSSDGQQWTLLADPPWNAATSDDVKYDFDSIVLTLNGEPIIVTAGGDRETFDFSDPENYKRVDDDIWVFGPG